MEKRTHYCLLLTRKTNVSFVLEAPTPPCPSAWDARAMHHEVIHGAASHRQRAPILRSNARLIMGGPYRMHQPSCFRDGTTWVNFHLYFINPTAASRPPALRQSSTEAKGKGEIS